MTLLDCVTCGEAFSPKNSAHIYCDPSCRPAPGKAPPPETVHTECTVCGNPLPDVKVSRRAKYCGSACMSKQAGKRYRELNGDKRRQRLPTGTVGAMHEMLVAYLLMRAGYEVFRAVSPACTCDLAVLKDGGLLRIEVRTGTWGNRGAISWGTPSRDAGRYDHYAIAMHDGQVFFDPPLSGLPGLEGAARRR